MNNKKKITMLLLTATAIGAYAQGNGIAGINEATKMVTSYFDPGTKLIYAIGAVVGLIVYVVKQKCTTLPPIKFGVLVRIINKKVYLHYDNKKEFFSKS